MTLTWFIMSFVHSTPSAHCFHLMLLQVLFIMASYLFTLVSHVCYIAQVRSFLEERATSVRHSLEQEDDHVAEFCSFSDFATLLQQLPSMVSNGLPGHALFFVPFCGILPAAPLFGSVDDYWFDVGAPESELVNQVHTRFDIDSVHLVSTYIPAMGPVDMYTLQSTSFTVKEPLHFRVQLPDHNEKVPLESIANFQLGQFGFNRCWHVSIASWIIVVKSLHINISLIIA